MADIIVSSSFINRWRIFFFRVLSGQFFVVETFEELTFAQQNFIYILQLITAFIIGYIVLWAVKKAISVFIWG